MKRFLGFLTVAMMAASGAKAQGIALVPVLGLPDAAQADAQQRIIFYDPQQLREIGPDMARFVLAHEEAHVRLGHGRPAAAQSDTALANAYERTADCQAAMRMVLKNEGNLDFVVRFFERVGSLRPDDDHPTGTERAQTIRSCATAATHEGRLALSSRRRPMDTAFIVEGTETLRLAA